MASALESRYQARLIKHLERMFPGCVIMKNDANRIQGIPDLIILWGMNWAMLEVKAAWDSPFQPNQEYWVEKLDDMSFAAVIYPENEEEVLRDLQQALEAGRSRRSRVSQR